MIDTEQLDPGASVTEQTREMVAEFLRRNATGDVEQIAASYAERVDWRVNWPVDDHPLVPWIRPRSTREDVADHFRTFAKCCEGEISIDEVMVDGHNAVVTGVSRQTVHATGKRFDMSFALHLRFASGLIAAHHMYEDGQSVVAAFVD